MDEKPFDPEKDLVLMTTVENFDEIENALDVYVREDPEHPDMKVFSATNGFAPCDVAEVIRTSQLLELTEPQKELLLNSFVKRDFEDPSPVILETNREWSKRKRKEIRSSFFASKLCIQDWLAKNPDVPEYQLRNILSKEEWKAHRRPDEKQHNYRELAKIFLEESMSVQQFCSEQGINMQTFQNYIPKEIWDARFERKRRVINWEEEIRLMIDSGLCLQDWAYSRNLSPTIFRSRCGEDIARRYDRDGRRAEAFDPAASLKENADKLGLSCGGLNAWINNKLKDLDPEKFRSFRMDEKDERIVALENQVRDLQEALQAAKDKISRLENHLANKNAQIISMQTSASQGKAKGEALVRTLREAIKAFEV